jgi:secreted trypsin-like serine protease
MRHKIFILGIILALLLVSSIPAQAISYGEFDGNDHPYVGSIVVRLDGNLYQWCSGTLIGETLFLTASHCTAPLDGFVAANPTAEVLVIFDPTIMEGGTFYAVSAWHTNPAFYTAHGFDDSGDVAVMDLAASPGITPASLPTAGLLDELKDQHLLSDTLFTAVGYGTVRETNHTGWQGILDNMDRNRAEQEFLSLTNAWLTNSMNLATGNGGTCYGDSGGPHFIHLDGVETDIVVSVTVTGDANCKATDKTYRVDTEAARTFLSEFIELP